MALSAARARHWQQILGLTRSMREQADAGDWSKIVELETLRKQQLQRFFQTPVDTEEVLEVTEGIRDMMLSDGELACMGEQARAEAARMASGLASGRRAMAAYDLCRK